MAKITNDNIGNDTEQGKFPYAAGGSILVQLFLKTVWCYLLKLTIYITYKLAIPLDQIEMYAHRHQETHTRMIIATLSIMSQNGSSKVLPTIQWLNGG